MTKASDGSRLVASALCVAGALAVVAWIAWLKPLDAQETDADAEAEEFSAETTSDPDEEDEDELTGNGPPSEAQAARLLAEFRRREATRREAAIRRLIPYPNVAALPAVNVFADGTLSVRLGVFELLTAWKAPIKGLDPWRSETLTKARLQALATWAGKQSTSLAAQAPAELSPDELQECRRMIAQMHSATADEAIAIRERLARYASALLPEVYQQLTHAESDQVRQRLTSLRYRLLATDKLVLSWPGGLERLAAMDAQERHRAADELARQAQADDEPLLLELFSDPEPLVREVSLRTLQRVGGTAAGSALVRLLKDPEPNVRAAVLKQLAEKPSVNLVPRIADYLAEEKDADLVVHAVRFLREAKGRAAIDCLIGLLKHESWQVRAEAGEALGKMGGRGNQLGIDEQSDVDEALIELLKDGDSFVVSRAIEALGNASRVEAVDALAQVAGAHPELAVEVVGVLSSSSKYKLASLKHLRQFFHQQDASVRAAAVTGIAALDADGSKTEIGTALQDPASIVRAAAAQAVFGFCENRRQAGAASLSFGGEETLEALEEEDVEDIEEMSEDDAEADAEDADEEHPEGSGGEEDLDEEDTGAEDNPTDAEDAEDDADGAGADDAAHGPTDVDEGETAESDSEDEDVDEDMDEEGEEKDEEEDDEATPELTSEEAAAEADRSLTRMQEALPAWIKELATPLTPLLSAEDLDERLAGALSLAALGRAEAVSAALDAAAGESRLVANAARALPWLPWPMRQSLFERLMASSSVDDVAAVMAAMAEGSDPRAPDLLWSAFARNDAGGRLAASVLQALQRSYFGQRYYDTSSIPRRKRESVARTIRPRAESGPAWQRLTALEMLLSLDRPQAAEVAGQMLAEQGLDQQLGTGSFQVLLLAQGASIGAKTASATLGSENVSHRRIALRYLAMGPSAIAMLGDGELSLTANEPITRYGRSSQPIELEPPRDVEASQLVPILSAQDQASAACAGYLLCLMDHPEGFAPLLDFWSRSGRADPAWTKLVYRAAAVLDSADSMPLLAEIYANMVKDPDRIDSGLSDFYWTIRVMTVPEALTLRKRIRDEVGVDNL